MAVRGYVDGDDVVISRKVQLAGNNTIILGYLPARRYVV
ncbi:hypothetical protein E2C01_093091 [Portunus trituberculatus]|uniref:Uncharacterized protein n=1 Tax=Portunus trituberculatus TaxID=210409 RepID=A0A5B7JI56_PORTR|nr:hypothetical protein [Portunus trituberculatus]